MAVYAQNPWTTDPYFAGQDLQNRGNPYSTTPGVGQRYVADLMYPCTEMSFAKDPQIGPISGDWGVTTENIRYKGMSQRESNKKLMLDAYNRRIVEELNRNPLFSNPDDGEKENLAAARVVEIKNPEFILSKVNDKEVEDDLQDTNAIAREWMTDPGMGVFNYTPPESNDVKMVIDANASFVDRRDRYFIPPQDATAPAQATLELLMKQEQEFQSMKASIPTRGKAGGGRRRL